MKKIFTLLFAFLAINSAWAEEIKSYTHEYTDDEGQTQEILLYYVINDDGTTASITNSSNNSSGTFNGKYQNYQEIIVPEEITDGENSSYTVTVIADYAFGSCYSATKAEFPNSVIKIGDRAIQSCYVLESVTLSENLDSIGTCAFRYDHSLKEITIPKNVKYIGDQAFYTDCHSLDASYGYPQDPSSLSTVTVEAINPPELGENVFVEYYDGESEETKKPTLNIPSGSGFDYYNSDWAKYFDIETISFIVDNLYYRVDTEAENDEVSIMYDDSYLSLNQAVTFPETVKYNNTTFTVTAIEDDAFLNCENIQASVNFIDPETIELGKIATSKVGYLAVPDGAVGLYEESDWSKYFEFDENNRYLEIDSVYFVFKADSAQTSSLKATHSSISVEVDHVDENATTVTIPSTISINLGDDINVSYEVTSMNADALKDCENLTSVTIDSSTPIECADALSQVPSGCTVIVPDDQYDQYLQMFSNAGLNLNSITIKATSNAISTIKVNEKIEISRYNLLGQRISSPQKGINIIKYSNGSVEKVLVK